MHTKKRSMSLQLLTFTFIQMITHAKDKRLNIEAVAKELKIEKRRIYDITNVLEGIYFIQKDTKNTFRWIKEEEEFQLEQFEQQYLKKIE